MAVEISANRIKVSFDARQISSQRDVLPDKQLHQLAVGRKVTFRRIQRGIFLRIVPIVTLSQGFLIRLRREDVRDHNCERLLLALFGVLMDRPRTSPERVDQFVTQDFVRGVAGIAAIDAIAVGILDVRRVINFVGVKPPLRSCRSVAVAIFEVVRNYQDITSSGPKTIHQGPSGLDCIEAVKHAKNREFILLRCAVVQIVAANCEGPKSPCHCLTSSTPGNEVNALLPPKPSSID